MQCYALKSLYTDGVQMVLKITVQLSFHRKSRVDGICYNEQYHKIETHLDGTEPKHLEMQLETRQQSTSIATSVL